VRPRTPVPRLCESITPLVRNPAEHPARSHTSSPGRTARVRPQHSPSLGAPIVRHSCSRPSVAAPVDGRVVTALTPDRPTTAPTQPRPLTRALSSPPSTRRERRRKPGGCQRDESPERSVEVSEPPPTDRSFGFLNLGSNRQLSSPPDAAVWQLLCLKTAGAGMLRGSPHVVSKRRVVVRAPVGRGHEA
jgi:hypothetical protein